MQLLLNKDFKAVSKALPKKIEDTFDYPKLCELVHVTGKDVLQAQLEYELIYLTSMINVGGNLTPAQHEFLASELIELYPAETLADFQICFRMAARGDFNTLDNKDIFRLDGIVLRRWMEAYLEIKYQKFEIRQSQAFREQQKENELVIDQVIERTAESLEQASDDLKNNRADLLRLKITGLTEDEIKDEGQERPARRKYTPPDEKYLRNFELKLQWSRDHTDLYTGTILPNSPTFEEWLKETTK